MVSSFELRLLTRSNAKQNNSSDQREPAKNGWNRDAVMIFPGDMHRPNIKDAFAMGVIESLIGESQCAQHN